MFSAYVKNKLNIDNFLEDIPEFLNGVKILKRATLFCSEVGQLRCLKVPSLLKFDIIAICPSNEDILNQSIRYGSVETTYSYKKLFKLFIAE